MVDFSSFQSQMMMLAGLVLLGWVLIRHQVRTRRRRHAQDLSERDLRRQLSKTDQPTGVPLATAPIETQRWQVEMFDLQRELKAELDMKIVVVQSLIRQADERIAALRANSNRG
jgi:flagellar biosynthesis/type III secretory pathway M-ring protein FliF/YscJ